MYYEINVTFNGQHLFATHPRSLLTEDAARSLFKCFCKKFPWQAGYVVEVSRRSETGQYLNW